MLFAILAALCLNYEIIDNSGFGLNDKRTKAVVARSIKVCDARYKGCLAKVTRNTETDYSSICRRGDK